MDRVAALQASCVPPGWPESGVNNSCRRLATRRCRSLIWNWRADSHPETIPGKSPVPPEHKSARRGDAHGGTRAFVRVGAGAGQLTRSARNSLPRAREKSGDGRGRAWRGGNIRGGRFFRTADAHNAGRATNHRPHWQQPGCKLPTPNRSLADSNLRLELRHSNSRTPSPFQPMNLEKAVETTKYTKGDSLERTA